jgi:phage gp36-like protein
LAWANAKRRQLLIEGLKMTYLTRSEFELRFGPDETEQLFSESGDFERCEQEAASLIDGYLTARYTLPLASVPVMVKGWAADITRFRLWDEHAPEEVRRRYEDALAQLKLLATGTISLPPGSDGTPQASGVAFGGFSAGRVFTTDTLRNF